MNDQVRIPNANGGPTATDSRAVAAPEDERDMTSPNAETATQETSPPKQWRMKRSVALAVSAMVLIGAAAALVVTRPWTVRTGPSVSSVRYLGVYEPDSPHSYAGISHFAQGIGRQPNIVSYYSSWLQPFQLGFADAAAKHGAVTLVQMSPTNVSIADIAAGKYDGYLSSYAKAVRSYRLPIILSFGHEMNGYWYSWGSHRTSATAFVAAWRHIVTVFRAVGTGNVIWLWTVNVTDNTTLIPSPAPWWPGSSYVTWVGIDGYYHTPNSSFSQIFGSTIVDVRALTSDPIFISETGADPVAGPQSKIVDLFAGVRAYGLLGFLWFDENYSGDDWRISSPQVFAVFRQQAKAFFRPSAK